MDVIKKIAIFVPAIGLIVWGCWSIKNDTNFYDVSLYQLFNLAIIIYIGFYLVQKYTDKRLLKQSATVILDKLEQLINDSNSYKITNQTDKDKVLMIQRQFKNKLLILKKNQEILQIKKEMDYIENKYNEYCEFIGDHIDDFKYLEKSEKDMMKRLNLIDNKFDEIRMLLHK